MNVEILAFLLGKKKTRGRRAKGGGIYISISIPYNVVKLAPRTVPSLGGRRGYDADAAAAPSAIKVRLSSSDVAEDEDDDESEAEAAASVAAVPVSEECASLLPGCAVQIRVGDLSAGRKAWKKRRRSGSPILVPCAITGISREWMVRWNVMSILHRYGESMGADVGGGGGSSYSSSSSSSTSYSSAPGGGGGDKYESVGGGRGVAMPVGKLCGMSRRNI